MAQPAGKQDAQREVDRLRNFRSYLAELEDQNVLELSLEQRRRLDGHLDSVLADLSKRFDIDVTESQKQLSLGMRVISALGGLAFCIAVFLFFYKIWGVISTPMQVAILVAVPVFSLAATEFAALRERSLYFASLGAIVACAAFVLKLDCTRENFQHHAVSQCVSGLGCFRIGFGVPLQFAHCDLNHKMAAIGTIKWPPGSQAASLGGSTSHTLSHLKP